MVAQFWFSSTKWNLLQFVTMPSCVGTGVATPFPGAVLVLVVVTVGGRVVGGVVDVGGRVTVDWVDVILLDAVVGGGSDVTSTQYERPPWSVPQFSGIDGFFTCLR